MHRGREDTPPLLISLSNSLRVELFVQLREFGFRKVTQCTKLAEAREQFSDSSFDVVMCEHNFAGETPTGIDLIDELREKGQLVVLDTPFWSLTRPLFMLVHRQKYQGPGLKAFMKFCEK